MPEEKQLDTLVPEWDTLPPENPPGNILASKLRNISPVKEPLKRHVGQNKTQIHKV